VTNTTRTNWISPGALVTEPRCFAEIDYVTVTDTDASGSADWTLAGPRTAHGLCVWFESDLAEGVTLSNAPGGDAVAYGRLFLPFSRPLDLGAGDSVTARFAAEQFDGDYIYRWGVEVRAASGAPKEALSQSTSYGVPLSTGSRRRGAAEHRPELGDEGAIDRFVLERMDGEATVEEIAAGLRESRPGRFATLDDARARVARLSRMYSR
jgi:hypothetical protein